MKLDKATKLDILSQIKAQTPNAVYTPKSKWLLRETKPMQKLLLTGNFGSASSATLKEAKRRNFITSPYSHFAQWHYFWVKNGPDLLGFTPSYLQTDEDPVNPKLELRFEVDGCICDYEYNWDLAFSLLRKWGFSKSELLSTGLIDAK